MIRVWFRVIIYFIVFALLQALVMNNIHLFGIVTPFIYLYAILKFPVDMTRSNMIILSFLFGLTIDMFSNTFGMHAAACSFIGFIRMPLLERFVDMKELPEGSVLSCRLFGFGKFMRYAFILVTLHHIVLFSIESFSFSHPLLMITRMLSSILLTSLLMFIIEAFNLGKVKSGE
ncbi:MAG: rod shape-determining protein MreD [Tannerella sp.]|jgi:rod shape-determining protein MreD|nr:rod shape-determining protein MreD [Tannerella sp.]